METKEKLQRQQHDDHFQCSHVHSPQVGVSQQVDNTLQLFCQWCQ